MSDKGLSQLPFARLHSLARDTGQEHRIALGQGRLSWPCCPKVPQDEPCTALGMEARQSGDVSELEVLIHRQGGWGSGRMLCQGVESRSSLAEAWGCEQWGAALTELWAGAEHGSIYTARRGFMLLTEELWMQNDKV